ncbi:MAG: hypothetical protein HYY52_00050 [Candidatus Melainabacteria bacterium]|nr:hypothetical protein [Candidatus Melainabacteria bacterium]
MKTVKISIPLVLALILYTAFSYTTYAESGSDKYTPTKLEWLATYLNSTNELYKGCLPSEKSCSFADSHKARLISIYYLPNPPNTITVTIFHDSEKTSEAEIESAFIGARMAVENFAKKKKWKWVKVQKKSIELQELIDSFQTIYMHSK